MSGLVSGLFDDARTAVGARVDVVRRELDDRLASLGVRLTTMLTAIAIIIVTAMFCGLSIGATLTALGVPVWAALWAVTLTAAALGGGFICRAKRRSTLALAVEPRGHATT
jgi:hypothetical protein